MSKRVVVAMVFGACLLCGAGLLALIWTIGFAEDRRAAERDRRRAAVELDMALQRQRQQNEERVAAPVVDWAEVAAAYTGPKPDPADAAEFAPLFTALGKALDRDDRAAVDRLCDLDRLLDEVIASSGRGDIAQAKAELEPDLKGAFARWMIQNSDLRWTRTEVARVEWRAGRAEAAVYVVHRPAFGDPFKALWWVGRRSDGWRVFDAADLFRARRFTRDPVTVSAPEVRQLAILDVGQYGAARQALAEAERALNHGLNAGLAEATLEPSRGVRLPPEDAALLALLEGRIASQRGDTEAALSQFDTAERLVPGVPAAQAHRAAALNRAGRFDAALDAVREYRRRCGPDGHASLNEGAALEGLGRPREAADVYRGALDDDPDSAAALRGLGRVLPANDKSELGLRLAKARDPRHLYDRAVWGPDGQRDEVTADVLLDALRKARPDDPHGLGEDIRRQIKAGRFDAAQKLMEHGLKAKERDDREEVLDAYLLAMARAKKLTEGYEAVPKGYAIHAFRTLAEDWADELFDRADKEPGPEVAELRELIAAHREREPNDPWLWFFEGAARQREKQYEKAAEAFAAGAKKLPPAPKKKPAPDEFDENAGAVSRFRSRRIECLFLAKKGLEAYARIEPTAEVFQELAGLYDRANDLDGLAALLAAHRTREPNDPQRLYWQGHLNFRDRNYAGASLLFKAFLKEIGGRDVMNRWAARDEYLRCALRTDPADAGRRLAEFGPGPVAFPLRAAVAAATGDRLELERLIKEATRGGGPLWFYSDEDFRAAFRQEQWADLRARYPDPNPKAKIDG